jgi:hypothetical protein
MTLGIGENLCKSFEFAKDGLVGHWVRWILLIIISAIPIVSFISSGYVVKIYKGGNVAPELEGYLGMFIDGLKLTIIGLIYTIIPIIILQAGEFFGEGELSTTVVALILVGVILTLVAGLFVLIAGVRFAKTGSMKEAFNFSAILETIQGIGWKHYILSYIAIIIVLGLIAGVLSGLAVMLLVSEGTFSVIGWVLLLVFLILMPLFLIWQGKFYENLYSLA